MPHIQGLRNRGYAGATKPNSNVLAASSTVLLPRLQPPSSAVALTLADRLPTKGVRHLVDAGRPLGGYVILILPSIPPDLLREVPRHLTK
jgi:hypothetical protein